MKKLLSIGFVAMLLLSMVMVMAPSPVSAGNAQDIWVAPDFFDTLKACDSFTVTVWVNISGPTPSGGKGMYGWEYHLKWNTTWLSLTSHVEPNINVPPLNFTNGYWVKKNVVTPGDVWCSATAMSPDKPFNQTQPPGQTTPGVTWLSNYTFHVEKSVFMPDPAHDEYIKMDLVGVLDEKVTDIITPFTDKNVVHCRMCPIVVPKPKLDIIPTEVKGTPEGPYPKYSKFNISICIYDLYPQWNLWGWEAKLRYPSAHLEAQASFEGPFLPSFVSPPHGNATTYINILNYTADTVLTAGSFNDANHTAPHCEGALGTLAKIEFNITCETIAPVIHKNPLELYEVKLVGVYPNNTVYSIQMFPPNNGTFQCPYKIVGWFMDCYTQVERKKCEAFSTGKGINATADPFEPQDLVILYAYLEYNFEPEAYKLVMFEIHGPPNKYYNITIYRTAYTNASGVATVNFTIPGSGEPYWQDMVMGHWTCYQAAQVKINKKPCDWLYFKVGWIIEITDVEVLPGPGGWAGKTGPKKCEWIEIVIHFKTIAFIPKNVCFTITILDELLDPIQWEFFWVLNVPPAKPELCSYRNDTTSTISHIPSWAHIGKATVYVNAFTDLPMNCGCPYCPEVTETFWILATKDP